jgi:hypothetical protein
MEIAKDKIPQKNVTAPENFVWFDMAYKNAINNTIPETKGDTSNKADFPGSVPFKT